MSNYSDLKNTVTDFTVTNLNIAGTGVTSIKGGSNLELDAPNRVVVSRSPIQLALFTTVERDALIPATGDLIFNTTLGAVQVWNGSAWVSLN